MKTISKVKSVQGSGSFESQYGAEQSDGKKLLFSYDYEFEDGTALSANHKTVPAPFKIGDTVEYEVTRESEQYGKSGKVSKPQEQSFQKPSAPSGDDSKGVKIGHSLNNAVALYIHERQYAKTPECDMVSSIKNYAKMILKIGEELNNEPVKETPLTNPNVTVEAFSPAKVEVLIPKTILANESDDDDLPF